MQDVIKNPYENFIALSRYARWLPDQNRRETWGETVDRFVLYMTNHLKNDYNYEPSASLTLEIRDAIFNRNIMPSMRAVMTAGSALDRDNVAGYNCSFLPVDSLRSFDEAMYILMCGTGVGFSVESVYVDKLPAVNEHFEKTDTEVFFMTGDMPMIMTANVEIEDLLTYLGEETIFPQGTELRTIEITFKDEQSNETEITEDRAS